MKRAIVCRVVGATFLLSFLGIGAVPLAAQTKYLTDAPGTWKPWKGLTASSGPVKDRSATPAELKAFESELLVLNAIVRRAPGVATPKGFSVETWANLDGYASPAPTQPAATKLPLAGALNFGAFPIFEYVRAGKTIREDTGETALLRMSVNQLDSSLFGGSKVPEWGSVNTDAFFQPKAGAPIADLPHYGDVLVIAKNPAPLWVPLPLGAALDLVVASRREELAGFQESFKKFSDRLAGLRDPVKQAERLKSVKESAAKMPNPDAFIAQMAQVAKMEEAEVVREIGPTGGTGKGLADAQRQLDDVTGWIGELPPAERASASCYAATGKTLRTKFRQQGADTACVALVSPNYKFFNASLPRSAPQVVLITPVNRCFDTANKNNVEANSSSPAGCAANRQLIQTLDKDAVRAWLR